MLRLVLRSIGAEVVSKHLRVDLRPVHQSAIRRKEGPQLRLTGTVSTNISSFY